MTVLVGVSACACPFLVMWSWWTFLKARDTAEAAARASLALTVVTVAGLTVVAARHLDFLNVAAVVGIEAAATLLAPVWLTYRPWGLVEINAAPPQETEREVLAAHQRLGPVWRDSLAKLTFDRGLSLVAFASSLWLWPVVSLLIWLEDPGPVFIAKIVVGRGGRSFRQLKFRTMVKAAERQTGPVLAAIDDPRTLRIGRFLRKTALDELPQIWNILNGDMSFVGPRPQRTVLVHRYLVNVPGYGERHRVRPGLTGVAQVFGHYYVTPTQKLRFDRIFLAHRSFTFDVSLFAYSLWISATGGWQNARRRERHPDFATILAQRGSIASNRAVVNAAVGARSVQETTPPPLS